MGLFFHSISDQQFKAEVSEGGFHNYVATETGALISCRGLERGKQSFAVPELQQRYFTKNMNKICLFSMT